MKTSSYKTLIPALVITVALMALSLAISSRVIAQGDTRFKVGDRVEVDTMFSQHPETSTSWRKGTIIRLYDPEDHKFGGFIIKMDDGREWRHRFIDTLWIRAPQGTDAPAADNNKIGDQAGANQTTTNTDKTGTVSCPASDDLKGTSQSAVFQRLIVARYEKNGKSLDENEKNVSVSVHFDDFKVGATHPYRHIINNPDGPDGVNGGTVYAVKTT